MYDSHACARTALGAPRDVDSNTTFRAVKKFDFISCCGAQTLGSRFGYMYMNIDGIHPRRAQSSRLKTPATLPGTRLNSSWSFPSPLIYNLGKVLGENITITAVHIGSVRVARPIVRDMHVLFRLHSDNVVAKLFFTHTALRASHSQTITSRIW